MKAQRYESILKVVSDYKDASYVIFDNCERILMHDDILRIFVHLLDREEYEAVFYSILLCIFI
jgi:hypothetical protein